MGFVVLEADDILATEFAARIVQRRCQLDFAGLLVRRALVAHKPVMVGQIAPAEMKTACHNCGVCVTTVGLDIDDHYASQMKFRWVFST